VIVSFDDMGWLGWEVIVSFDDIGWLGWANNHLSS
jgi:hypothetical protein